MEKLKVTKKVRAHTVYRDEQGNRVPSVTTVIGKLNKPLLVKWANNIGLQGIDTNKYVDELATIGTLTHNMVEHDCNPNVTVDYKDYSQNQIDRASIAFKKWEAWRQVNEFIPEANEIRLVGKWQSMDNSTKVRGFGGTIDIYGTLNGKKTLIDIKTSKACYIDQYIQVGAYKLLLEQNGYEVEQTYILRIGRNENEGFQDIHLPNLDLHQQIFERLLDIYYLEKEIKK